MWLSSFFAISACGCKCIAFKLHLSQHLDRIQLSCLQDLICLTVSLWFCSCTYLPSARTFYIVNKPTFWLHLDCAVMYFLIGREFELGHVTWGNDLKT